MINLLSKRALPGVTFGSIKQEVGSFSSLKTVVDLNTPIGDGAALRLPLSYRKYGSYIDFLNRDSFNFSPALSVDLTPQTKLSILANFVRLNEVDNTVGVPTFNGRILNLPRSRFLGRPGVPNTADLTQVAIEVEHKFLPELMLTSSYSYLNGSQINRDTSTFFGVLPDGRTLSRLADETGYHDVGHITEHNLVWDTALLGREHRVLVGVDYVNTRRAQRSNTGFAADIDAYLPIYHNSVPDPRSIFDGYTGDARLSQLGLYAQDQITVLRDLHGIHKLILMGGCACGRSCIPGRA